MGGFLPGKGRRVVRVLQGEIEYNGGKFQSARVGAMRILTFGTLRDYWQRHRDAEEPLRLWYNEARQAHWNTPAEVRERYSNASIVGSNRVVFRIKGNAYRLVVRVDYQYGQVYIRFIGTHAEYNRINAAEV